MIAAVMRQESPIRLHVVEAGIDAELLDQVCLEGESHRITLKQREQESREPESMDAFATRVRRRLEVLRDYQISVEEVVIVASPKLGSEALAARARLFRALIAVMVAQGHGTLIFAVDHLPAAVGRQLGALAQAIGEQVAHSGVKIMLGSQEVHPQVWSLGKVA